MKTEIKEKTRKRKIKKYEERKVIKTMNEKDDREKEKRIVKGKSTKRRKQKEIGRKEVKTER